MSSVDTADLKWLRRSMQGNALQNTESLIEKQKDCTGVGFISVFK
jgi:hypothetical protein